MSQTLSTSNFYFVPKTLKNQLELHFEDGDSLDPLAYTLSPLKSDKIEKMPLLKLFEKHDFQAFISLQPFTCQSSLDTR